MDNVRTEWLLHGEAEPAAVMAMARGRPYPARLLERAWRYVLECHTHDAIAGCAPDAVCEDLRFRFRQARGLAAVVVDRSYRHVVGRLDLAVSASDDVNLMAFNSLPFRRSDLVAFEVAIPGKRIFTVALARAEER